MGVPATHKSATKEDWGEDNKDSDWLMEPSIVLHCATLKKSIKSLPQLLQKVELSSTFWVLLSVFYFLCSTFWNACWNNGIVRSAVSVSYTWQFSVQLASQQNCKRSCCLGMLHLPIFGATCTTTKLQDKLLSWDVTLGNFGATCTTTKLQEKLLPRDVTLGNFRCNLHDN